MSGLVLMFYGLKCFLLFSLARSLIKYEPLQKHVYFLAILYTAIVGFISFVFVLGPQFPQGIPEAVKTQWEYRLGILFLLSAFYFYLLNRFDQGILFWIILLAGFGLVWF